MLQRRLALLLLCACLEGQALPSQAQALSRSSAAEPVPDKDGVYATSLAIRPPVLVYQADPEFTEQARKKKIKGEVIVGVVVDKTGKVRDARVEHGLGSDLDEAAVKCVEQYRFKPALLHGEPVPVRLPISVDFQIF